MSVLSKLRGSLAPAPGYRVNSFAIERLAHAVRSYGSSQESFDWSDPTYWPPKSVDPAQVSQYFAVGNAVNFRYWQKGSGGRLNFEEGVKGGLPCSGSRYMWRCLRVCIESGDSPILDSRHLASLTVREANAIFSDDAHRQVMPAMAERVRNLRDLGRKLSSTWQGSFWNVVSACGGSLDRFVDISAAFRAFDDPLCKLTMVNAIMLQGRGLVQFDADFLPGIDYQLTKQLVRQGAVLPPEPVSRKLMASMLLTTSEGRDLRATCLFALLEIGRIAGQSGEVVDNLYWSNGRRCDELLPVCHVLDRERECPFLDACDKRTSFMIPLEHTRYY